jgi:hypothetical protein
LAEIVELFTEKSVISSLLSENAGGAVIAG